MHPQRNSYERRKDSMSKKSKQPIVGFGSAENKEQDKFDKKVQQMSEQEVEQGVSQLVSLYRSKKAQAQS